MNPKMSILAGTYVLSETTRKLTGPPNLVSLNIQTTTVLVTVKSITIENHLF